MGMASFFIIKMKRTFKVNKIQIFERDRYVKFDIIDVKNKRITSHIVKENKYKKIIENLKNKND